MASRQGIRLSAVNAPDGDISLEVLFGENSLSLTYSRDTYTPKLERELAQLINDRLPGNMLAAMLIKVLRTWDVVDVHPEDKNKPEVDQRLVPVPLSESSLTDLLSVAALSKIVEAMAEDQRPKLTTSESANDTF